MGGWCPRKLNYMGGWVKKRCRLPSQVFFSGIALTCTLSINSNKPFKDQKPLMLTLANSEDPDEMPQ